MFIELLRTFDRPIPDSILYQAIRAASMPFVLAILYQDTISWDQMRAVFPYRPIHLLSRPKDTLAPAENERGPRKAALRALLSPALLEFVVPRRRSSGQERYKYRHSARLETDEQCRKV